MLTALEFRILGPLQVLSDRPVNLRAHKQRTVLGALLLHPNAVVSTDLLIDYVWDGQRPANPQAALQIHITRLRKILKSASTAPPKLIRAQAGGYLIEVTPGQLDLERFEYLRAQIVRASYRGDLVQESLLLNEALGLWRGPVLSDVSSDTLHRDEVPRLTEQWAALMERRFGVELRLGRHVSIIGDLHAATKAHPLQENLWCHLMLALYRSGRRAEALGAYRAVAGILREELGLDPGKQLATLHGQMLQADAELVLGASPPEVFAVPAGADEPGTRPVVPVGSWQTMCQLPAQVTDFTGREQHIAQIRTLLTGHDADVPIVILTGAPGMGKTALGVLAAHLLSDEFPDGQLYVRIGDCGTRQHPADVLGELLHTTGVPPNMVPEGTEARASLFRAHLSGRRVLLLLDDVADADQVTPLLPGTPGSAVLVISRNRLSDLVALHGAKTLVAGSLTSEEARELLRLLLGKTRAAAEWPAVSDLARLCCYLPLALRIAAASLADRPGLSIRGYVRELRDGDTLTKLAVGRTDRISMRAAFWSSYLALSPGAQRLLRRMAIMQGEHFTGDAANRISVVDQAKAELDELVSAHLVEVAENGRYRFNALFRLFTIERARAEADDQ